MENEKRSMRPLSTQKLSNVDRELQRIKSLAVVSVLNKTFEDSTPIPLLSSSSSTTTTSAVNLERSRTRSASNSSNGSLGIKTKQSNTSLYHDFNKNTPRREQPRQQQPLTGTIAETQAEVNITREQLVSSPVDSNEDLPHDTEKEKSLQKRLIELQSLYELSLDKLKSTESRADAQTQLILMQDKLVDELSNQIEYISDNNNNNTSLITEEEQASLSSSALSSSPEQVSLKALLQAQEELVTLKNEVLNFKPLKEEYEMLIVTLSRKLADSQARVEKMERTALDIKKECSEQTMFIDTKVQVMQQQLQEKNKIIRKLEREIEKGDNIEPLENSVNSARSSIHSSNSQRKSFVAKWKGGSIPPAAPPPTLPLPPVPVVADNRPKSYVSIASSNHHHLETIVASSNMSIDAVGGTIQPRRLSNFSEFETEMTDAEYYKEFTDQLQVRLSISKEVDDLRLWEPSDFAEIQRKIDSNKWFDDDDDEEGEQGQHHGKDQSAFWKGMKKKLRV